MRTHARSVIACLTALLSPFAVEAHTGPDPVAHWVFNSRTVDHDHCEARLGPGLTLKGDFGVVRDSLGESLDLIGWNEVRVDSGAEQALPSEHLTVSAWVLIDEAERWGGIVGTLDPKGERGWSLGYDSDVFTFALAGAESGRLVEIKGSTPYAKGQWFHVVGVYDGLSTELYVNGRCEARSDEPNGRIAYGDRKTLRFAGRPDKEGSHPMRGRLREVSVYDLAAKSDWVRHQFEHNQKLVAMKRESRQDELALVVKPYLQHGTQEGMTVMWQTTRPGTSVVRYGETDNCERTAEAADGVIHEVRIEGLDPQTQYFYRVETVDASGQSVGSRPSTFSTAVREETPFAFAIISDTQTNADVAYRIATHAWAQRPSFLLHPGDLVETGVNDAHWTQQFFPSMHPLVSRVPMFSVLGNHEQNASNYYDYVSAPDPEYYYEFRYGNAHYFMIDTNRNVGPGSEQHEWLNKALAKSEATWKFACHHHPPYSSDENDYGNLWKTNKSTRGDLRARELSKLYDKHGVDVVWNGHIHSYERTWPVKEGKAVAKGGPIYMIVGGGGGGLETPGPSRPFFQNQVRRSHHYVMAHINGTTLEIRSYDINDQLFDTVRLTKE